MITGVATKDERGSPAPVSARGFVEERLEPGEPIEAFLRLASTGPAPGRLVKISRSGCAA